MSKEEYQKIIDEIATLPSGGITYKKINGKEYAYYQWREDGKQRSRRAKDAELAFLIEQIEHRKSLQHLLKYAELVSEKREILEYPYHCALRIGEELERFIQPVASWKKRECYQQLHNYIYGDVHDRVFILYGLRRTGKTTLIRQVLLSMDEDMRKKAVFMQVQEGRTLADVNQDLMCLEKQGYRYVFIDEVTLLEDFIEGAALFSDIFAASGMKVVLSGTDSLGFVFTEDEELYDRCIMAHTTYIPYREFETVLGIKGIDQYIRYGGTMSLGGKLYNEDNMIFSTRKSTNEYVDSAIAHNIQHSLKNYHYEGHFRSLGELYEKDELTSVINRIVEDMNHRFTIEVLTKDFKSGDLSRSAKNLRKDVEQPTDILDRVDAEQVNKDLKELLEIRNRAEQTVKIKDVHRSEIKEYLDLLDLTVDIENRWMSDYNQRELRTVFSQPGMRYSQAEALIHSLIQDEKFRGLSLAECNRVTERILDGVRGQMMEDIVLLETKLARPESQVFCLQFSVGEFDMVVFDPKNACCEIYEIKHSKEVVAQQRRHLLDERKCADTEFRYGEIVGKYVIYRGENHEVDGVEYLNVEEYLKAL